MKEEDIMKYADMLVSMSADCLQGRISTETFRKNLIAAVTNMNEDSVLLNESEVKREIEWAYRKGLRQGNSSKDITAYMTTSQVEAFNNYKKLKQYYQHDLNPHLQSGGETHD